jgi:plastocyanin
LELDLVKDALERRRTMRSKLGTALVLVLALGLVAGACSKSSTTPGAGGSSSESSGASSAGESGKITVGSDQANNKGTKEVTGLDEIELEIDDFYFEPTVFTGTAGQQIKLELANESNNLHNFSLDEQSVNQDVAAGEDMNVTVTFPQSGTLVFYCKFHRTRGMAGGLQASA